MNSWQILNAHPTNSSNSTFEELVGFEPPHKSGKYWALGAVLLWRKEVSLVILSFQLGSWKLLQLSLEAFTDSIDGIHVCFVWFLRHFVLKFWKQFLI